MATDIEARGLAAGAQEELDTIVPKLGTPGGVIQDRYLPSYIDKIVEYPTKANFPATGADSTIYVAVNEGRSGWRWSGTAYYPVMNGYECIRVNPTDTRTIAQFKTIVDGLNSDGRHGIFDLSQFGTYYANLERAFMVLVDFYDNGTKVRFIDQIGGYVYDSQSAFTGSQNIDVYCQSNKDEFAYISDIPSCDTVTSAQWATYTGNAEIVDVLD